MIKTFRSYETCGKHMSMNLILKIELTNRPMPLKGQLDQIQFDPLSLDLKAKPCRVHQQRMDK